MIIKMFEIQGKEIFVESLNAVKDNRVKIQIIKRIERLRENNRGDFKNLEGSLYELRIPAGKGWRVYYLEQGREVVLLMLTGSKPNQRKDIEKVKRWADEYITKSKDI